MPWDINGDGFADFVTGAYGEDLNTVQDAGIFHVLPGGADGLTGTGSKIYTQDTSGVPDVAQTGDLLGGVQASGDFNTDGYADVAVSAQGEDLGTVKDSGLVHVFYGSETGLRTDTSRTYSLLNTAYGARVNAAFGYALAAGDFDGDGDSDLAIGAPDFGRVFVVKGSATGLGSFLSVFSQDSAGVPGVHKSNDLFGNALSSGDANGDGRDDLAIGAQWDWEDRGWATGSVTVLYGSATGLSGAGAQRWSKDSPGIGGVPALFGNHDWPDDFGLQVALADYNGDGFADLAAGAPGAPVTYNSVKRQDAGTVSIIYGSASGLTSSGSKHLSQASTGMPSSPETSDHMGLTLAAGDANGDGRAELGIFTAKDELVTVITGASRFAAITAQAWTQNTAGIFGSTEANDGFGASLRFAHFRGGPLAGLAVGIPGEDNFEGAVEIIYGSDAGLTSTGSKYFTQDTAGVPDVAQADDWFGSFF
jgi:FG-GAP repeat